MAIQDLFGKSLKAVNVGLEAFAASLETQAVDVIRVDWRPPLENYKPLACAPGGEDIDVVNAAAVTRIRSGRPLLVGMGVARDVIPGLGERMLLHAGPPITWERMCGPQRGAVMGAAVYEGWAKSYEEAAAMAAAGEFTFAPCHHHHTVGPMAGIVSPSMPVFFDTIMVFTECISMASMMSIIASTLRGISKLRCMPDITSLVISSSDRSTSRLCSTIASIARFSALMTLLRNESSSPSPSIA